MDVLCPNTKNNDFDHFLYSRIDWLDCMIYQNGSGSDEWCVAMKSVTLNSDYEAKNFWFYESKRPQQFLKDRTTLWKWLRQVPTNKDLEPEYTLMVEKKSL